MQHSSKYIYSPLGRNAHILKLSWNALSFVLPLLFLFVLMNSSMNAAASTTMTTTTTTNLVSDR